MAVTKNKKDPAAVALGRKGGKKGGPARAAKLTPAQRSESARKAVQARWTKAKTGDDTVKRANMGIKPFSQFQKKESEAVPGHFIDTSKKALHVCLKRIKDATSEEEIRRLTEELQRI